MTALLLLALSLPCVYWARGVESRAVLEAAAIKRVDPADLAGLGAMLTFLEALPPADLPAVSDLAVVDDGSAEARSSSAASRPMPGGRDCI